MVVNSSDRGQYSKVHPPNVSSRSASTRSKDGTQRHRSWRAPAIMVAALLVGLAMALAHHFMCVRLNDTDLDQVGVSQTWISRFSTALAFLVKMFFVISVGVAFIQRQWLNFHHQPYRISDIDAVTGVLGNVLEFLTLGLVWFRNPLLTILAIVSWTIPFAAVITPGSLTVQPVRFVNTSNIQVPQPTFNGSTYAQIGEAGAIGSVSADDRVYKLAYTTAMSARLGTVSSKYQNESYHLSFHGPAIKCSRANTTVERELTKAFEPHAGGDESYIPFVSWVPGDDHGIFNSTGSTYLNMSAVSQYLSLDKNTEFGPRIFVLSALGYEPAVTECELYNATYDADFRFQFPQQEIKHKVSEWLNPVNTWDTITSGTFDRNETISAGYAYLGIMDAFGKLLVGTATASHYGFTTTYFTNYALLAINWTEPDLTRRGLEQLFQNITLSMMSDDTLIKNSTQASSIPVSITSYPIKYVYQPFDLLLAYGLSFFCALGCTLIGLHAFFVNGASYQNNFSSFVRVTGDKELHALVEADDGGEDPVPKRLARARIMIGGGGEGGMKAG